MTETMKGNGKERDTLRKRPRSISNGGRSRMVVIFFASFFCVASLFPILNMTVTEVTGEQKITDGDFTYAVIDGNAELTKYSGSDTLVQIPLSVTDGSGTYDVTSIGESAFEGNSSIERVVLSDNITHIGDFAFTSCSNLTSIHLAKVRSVGSGIFLFTDHLNDMTVDADSTFSVTDGKILLSENGTKLVAYPSASGDVTVPTEVTVIGKYAFSGSLMGSIDVLNSKTIEDYAFTDCYGLKKADMKNADQVGIGIFAACRDMTEILVNDDNEDLSVLDGKILLSKDGTELVAYPSVSGAYTVPEEVTVIRGGAFPGSDITSIDMRNVTYIGAGAFENCDSLISVKGDAVTEIADMAFINCGGITEISFPEATTVGEAAFYGTTITVADLSSAEEIGTMAFEDSDLKYITIRNGARYEDSFPQGTKIIFVEGNVHASVKVSGNEITVTVTPVTGFSIQSSELYYIEGGDRKFIGTSDDSERTFDPSPADEYFLSADTGEILYSVTATISEGKGTIRYRLNEEGEFNDLKGTLNIREGSTIEIMVVPSEGYEFTEWNDGRTDEILRFVNLDENIDMTAKFQLADGMVIVKIPVSENGHYKYRVDGKGEFVDVPEDNEIVVSKWCTIEIMAVPSEGYEFAGWNDGNTHPISRIDDVSVMDISAIFVVSKFVKERDANPFLYLLLLTMLIAIFVSAHYVLKRE